jgi:hypothetical protein
MLPPTTACGGASPPRRVQEPDRTSFAPIRFVFHHSRGAAAFPLRGEGGIRGECRRMTDGGMLYRCVPPPPPAAEPPRQGEAKNRAELPSLRSALFFITAAARSGSLPPSRGRRHSRRIPKNDEWGNALPMLPPTTACGGASPPRRGQEPSRTSFAPIRFVFHHSRGAEHLPSPFAGKVAFEANAEE